MFSLFGRSQSHLFLGFLRYSRGHERRMSEVWHSCILIDPKRESWKGTGEEKHGLKVNINYFRYFLPYKFIV